MNGARGRWLAWTGPIFTVVFAIAAFVLEGNLPGEKSSGDKVVTYFGAHQGRTEASAFLAPLGAALLVLFASYLRSVARDRGDSRGVGPTVLVAGAVLWASGLLLGAVLDLGLVSAAHHHQTQVAQTLNVFSNDDWIPFIAGIAVTLIGAGMTVLGTRILPSWLGWVALVVGVISLLGPGGFLGFFVAPVWLLVAGVMLGLRKEPAAASA
jgi:hypothetical protein